MISHYDKKLKWYEREIQRCQEDFAILIDLQREAIAAMEAKLSTARQELIDIYEEWRREANAEYSNQEPTSMADRKSGGT